MHRLLTFISTLLLFTTLAASTLKAQVLTGIGDFRFCYNQTLALPVVVQNMNSVDNFRLVLEFNSNSISFIEHFAVNSNLSGGAFDVELKTDSIVINWARASSATIVQDTLVWLRFMGIGGTSALHWNTTGSFYHTSGGNTPAVFIDGNADVNSRINVLISEIDPTCSSKCDANYMANASGGKLPYTYRWNNKPGRFDSIQTNMCAGSNLVSIIDAWGCRLDSTYTINGLPGANVKLIIEGNEDTTIYLQNPVLKFSFEEIFPTHVVEPPLWEFGDGDTIRAFSPTHVYDRAITNIDGYYDLKLHITNENGCDTLLEVRIPIKEAKLKIPGVITPNGDSYNELFMILNENKTGSGEEIKITNEFQRMELVVFDRWGRKIYDDSNYQSDWGAKGVPDGSYYFILKTIGFYRTEKYKGSITILGSGLTN